MYRSSINIKHGCLTHLFWGKDRDNGEYIHIQDVEKNGLGCNCQCPVCDGFYIACMGEQKRPYFKHQSKYKCMYTDEITTYLRTKQILNAATTMVLPHLSIPFGQRTFLVEGFTGAVECDSVFYYCEEEQYPPLLLVNIDNRPTRILLAFEGYYTPDDFSLFRNEAIRKKWDCLVFRLPKINSDDFLSTPHLRSILLDAARNKHWLHSELEPYWRERLQECVVAPATIVINGSEACACPIHKQLYDNQYYAAVSDCEDCPYNFGTGHDCRCAAHTGITRISDFNIPEEQRLSRIEQVRAANEQSILDRKRATELAEQKKLMEAAQPEMSFYLNKTCPKCGKSLKQRLGLKGTYWHCFGNQCGFYVFENHETGELIMHGIE